MQRGGGAQEEASVAAGAARRGGAEAAPEWVRPCAGVFGADYGLSDVNVIEGMPSPSGALKDLDQIPASAWTQVQEPDDGYHYLCQSFVFDYAVRTLLDGGAVFSLTWEATVVHILNSAISAGKTPDDPE